MVVFLMLSSDINIKNLAFTPYCGVGVVGDTIKQTFTMTSLSATVSLKCVGVGGWGWGSGYKFISLLQRALVHACA